MTQLGELVGIATMDKGPCPLCESKEKNPKSEELDLHNDSLKLANYLGKQPGTLVPNLDGTTIPDPHYYIKERYWNNDATSVVAANAHHIIPGNASLSRCPALLKWMAGKVTFTKVRYEKLTKAKAHLAGTTQSSTVPGPPDIVVMDNVILSGTGASLKHTVLRTVNEQHVTGKIDYDVNKNRNGAWLPSNNAIDGWGGLSGVFKSLYAKIAMRNSGFQFHDAHPNYSNEVKLDLAELDKKLTTKKAECILGCTPSQDPPPAPKRLTHSLETLSTELAKFLKLSKGTTVTGNYYTSDHANGFTP